MSMRVVTIGEVVGGHLNKVRKVRRNIDSHYATALAGFLTKEKLTVRTEKGAQPHWNWETRTIVLPPLPTAPKSVHSMLILHETGHVRFTDEVAWSKFIVGFKKFPWLAQQVHQLLNVYEDTRVDRFNKLSYHADKIYQDAADWNFRNTYTWNKAYVLIGFSELVHSPANEYDTSFSANKHNSWSKLCGNFKYAQNDIEREFDSLSMTTETFEQVVNLCKACLTNMFGSDLMSLVDSISDDDKSEIDIDTSNALVLQLTEDTNPKKILFNRYADRYNITRKVVYDLCKKTLDAGVSVSGVPLTKQDIKAIRKLMVSVSQDMKYVVSSEFTESLEELDKLLDTMKGKKPSEADKYKLRKLLSSMTVRIKGIPGSCDSTNVFDELEGDDSHNSYKDDNFGGDVLEFSIPDKYKLLPLKSDVIEQYGTRSSELESFMQYIKPIVANMANEFYIKKAACQVRNTKRSKSGDLDDQKLAEYRTSDTVFLRNKKVYKHKNHGLCFMIDMSGSMSGKRILSSVQNVIVITEFCNSANIPYEVYGFTTGGSQVETPTMVLPDVGIYQLFTSYMPTVERTKHVSALYEFAASRACGYVSMGGTPLDSSLVVLMDLSARFKANKNIDVLSTVVLTDGDDNDNIQYKNGSNDHPILIDKYNKNMYYPSKTDGNTKRVLQMFKDLIGGNLIGIMLDSSPRNGVKVVGNNNMYTDCGYDIVYSYSSNELDYSSNNQKCLTFCKTFVSMISSDFDS